jgi:hypothetical protein
MWFTSLSHDVIFKKVTEKALIWVR